MGKALKPVCPYFEFRSAGNSVARIACKGHLWMEWMGRHSEDKSYLEKRNEHYKQCCCSNPANCKNYKVILKFTEKVDKS